MEHKMKLGNEEPKMKLGGCVLRDMGKSILRDILRQKSTLAWYDYNSIKAYSALMWIYVQDSCNEIDIYSPVVEDIKDSLVRFCRYGFDNWEE